MNDQSVSKIIEESHSAVLYNKLIKSQHEILLSQINKIESLSKAIQAAKQKRKQQHQMKLQYYERTKMLLEEQMRRKDAVISKINTIQIERKNSNHLSQEEQKYQIEL